MAEKRRRASTRSAASARIRSPEGVRSAVASIVPPARFANYVVAHSEVSGPLARRMALLGIVGTEGAEATDQPETRQPETKQPEVRGTVDAP